MTLLPLRDAALLLALITLAPMAAAQNDSPLRDRGVGENRAAERLMRADAAADAAARRGETPEPEAPVVAEPLPAGSIDVGTVQTEPLEEGEEPDPEGDAESRD